MKPEIKNKNFKVEITETLQRTVEIKAKNKDEAIKKIKKMYENEEIVLDYNDFIDVEFQ